MHTGIQTFTLRSLSTQFTRFTRRSLGVGGGIIGFLFFSISLFAQSSVKWSFSTKDVGNAQVDLIITGTIKDGFYTYSQFLESEDGPVPTTLTFQEGDNYKLIGKAKESGDIVKTYDKVFSMNLTKFKHKAIFTQRVAVKDPGKPIVGYLNYMACNDDHCEPPRDVDFSFTLPALKGGADVPVAPLETGEKGTTGTEPGVDSSKSTTQIPPADSSAPNSPTPPNDSNFKGFFYSKRADINAEQFASSCGNNTANGGSNGASWVSLFIFCFLGGLVALFTPCMFPMIPMTVSFFVKRSKSRRAGIINALIYGTSIVAIFVIMGSAVTAIFGASVLNEMSTNPWFNLSLFALLIVFAFSFFGFYEIQLPSSWINKSDKLADRGGAIGIFFMALTLVLVSFSCTGPIVGPLLAEAAKSNDGAVILGFVPLKPAIGMLGFGLGMALPFALFAMFPGWLNSLPKSGGWMDNVKVTLGMIELAFAFKFLSTADMVEQWGVLKFETFMVIWVLCGLALGFYQFRVLKWKGNESKPGLLRSTVGLASLVFAAYVGWGLAGYKSLSLLSGLAPPVHYSYKYDAAKKDHKGPGCPHGLDCYHDFDEAIAIAKLENKPLFVDFTGHGCTNCRAMEETVWPLPGVIEHLRNDYVVVSLYVDEKVRLFPENDFAYLLDPKTGEKLRTVGSKWAAFQVNNFNTSTQPYYVLMHHDGKTLLNRPSDYDKGKDPAAYKAFLECGLSAFETLKKGDNKEMLGLK